jgi:diadenosine tetraphosphate (Ap4A) HIT family hydrolase/8-oxo-dGTP pyrophosphatase MutT (NUDIX family)
MPAWNDTDAWTALRDGTACPICLRGGPLGVVAELETAFVTAGEDDGIKGYCCLVSKRHAVELHDLTPAEGAAFMRDLQRLSAAVSRVTAAVKLNYEIHGNTLPHLHAHLYPRHPGDAFEGGPIDSRRVRGRRVYAPGEFDEFVSRLRATLGPGAPHTPGTGGLNAAGATIRPLAICVLRHGDHILVTEGVDPETGARFARPLGGGVEVGETSASAVVRELREEIGADLTDLRLLGVLENLFTYDGSARHEIVFVYDARLIDERLYASPTITIREAGWTSPAVWKRLDSFRADCPLFPAGLLDLLNTRTSG